MSFNSFISQTKYGFVTWHGRSKDGRLYSTGKSNREYLLAWRVIFDLPGNIPAGLPHAGKLDVMGKITHVNWQAVVKGAVRKQMLVQPCRVIDADITPLRYEEWDPGP